MVLRYAAARLPTAHGEFVCYVYRSVSGLEHVALVVGEIKGKDVLCRIHSECLTSEVFGSLKCDCKQQLDMAMDVIAQQKRGVLIYLRQEGRGIGLGNKIRAYALQDAGRDTVDANRDLGFADDTREYQEAAEILHDLGVESVELMTNNPSKIEGLSEAGIQVTKRRKHAASKLPHLAETYVKTKYARLGHMSGD